jgi:hypothetical protein
MFYLLQEDFPIPLALLLSAGGQLALPCMVYYSSLYSALTCCSIVIAFISANTELLRAVPAYLSPESDT